MYLTEPSWHVNLPLLFNCMAGDAPLICICNVLLFPLKQIIRTHLLLETSSDYIGLVPEKGLEPPRCYPPDFESGASAIPPLRQAVFDSLAQE